MAEAGDLLYCLLVSETGTKSVCGWAVEVDGDDVVLATTSEDLAALSHKTIGENQVGFVRVALSAVGLSAPADWKGRRPKDLPSCATCERAWKKVGKKDLASSEAEAPTKIPAPRSKGLAGDLKGLRALYTQTRAGDDSDEEDEGTEDDEASTDRRKMDFLPPGGRVKKTKAKAEGKAVKGELDMNQILQQSLAAGQSPNELVPLMMMAMLMDQKKNKKKKKDRSGRSILGGSDSEDTDSDDDLQGKGMKAVSQLNRLHEQIHRRPRRICDLFEKEVIEELGIVKGQAWTLRDYVRKQQWGKFKGIYRCAMMDVAVYESLRANEPQVAAAQVVQNLKAKLQSVLQGGDWATAWLLTGLPDPCSRREFAGSREEMAIVSGYVESLSKLQKRVRENHNRAQAEEETEEPASSSHKKCTRLELSSDVTALFPSMLPYPEALLPAGAEVGSDQVVTWWSKAFLNAFIAWGNFVTLGCPGSDGSAFEPRVGHRCVEAIRAFSDELLGEMREFVSLELVLGELGCEGKRASVQQLLDQVAGRAGASYVIEPTDGGLPSTALPVVAERLAIPARAGQVDPCDWLAADRAAVVNNLEKLRLPEPLWEDVVVACHRVAPEEEPALARRMLETGMAALVPEADLPRDQCGKLLGGGLFCVAKNQQEDRLIYDRRPENATMPRLRWATLPSGACFTRLLLEPNQYLRGSGDDLRNYYYSLRLPEGWVRYNSVGRRVHPDVVRDHGGDPAVDYRLCFRVLGMGDKNGCCIAQATHEAVLRRHGVLDASTQLVYGQHVPGGDLWEGVYLDDLLVTQKCTMPYEIPVDGTFIPPEAQVTDADMQQMQKAELAYLEAGLERAVHKAFRAQTLFKAWGAQVDGIRGTVGAPLDVRQQLWVLLGKLVSGGFASKEVLRKIVGYLAFAFQYRRELYSLMHHLYKYIDRMPQKRWIPIPKHIQDELRSCALHLPFAKCSMRRRLQRQVCATDATPTTGGAVMADVPVELASELWRRTELRGQAVRLDRERDLQLDATVPEEPSKFGSVVAECVHWRIISGYTFRQTSHINLQEARALRRELIKLAADPSWRNSLVVCLNDSNVVVGAFTKGRSSSYRLNGILRGLVPHLVLANLGVGLIWIETSSNRADQPSRGEDLPPPLPAPRWLQDFGITGIVECAGLEVGIHGGELTRAHRDRGFIMGSPVALDEGLELMFPVIEAVVSSGRLSWAWFAPPRKTFSALRSLDRNGPLRPKGYPEGDEAQPEVAAENLIWRRTLSLVDAALQVGCYVVVEHPATSRAWRLRETQLLMQKGGLKLHRVDLCAYRESGNAASVPRQRTRLLSNAPWLKEVVHRCPGDHWRGSSLRVENEYLGCATRLSLLNTGEAAADFRAIVAAYLGRDKGVEDIDSRAHAGECHKLKVEDLLIPDLGQPLSNEEGMVITIRKPKTRRVWRSQFVLVKSHALISWMRWWAVGRRAHRSLFPIGRREWAKCVAAALEELGLRDRGYTLSSFRGGGATYMFQQSMHLAQLQYHGRWARQETLKSYLQEAFCAQVSASASATARANVIAVNNDWLGVSGPTEATPDSRDGASSCWCAGVNRSSRPGGGDQGFGGGAAVVFNFNTNRLCFFFVAQFHFEQQAPGHHRDLRHLPHGQEDLRDSFKPSETMDGRNDPGPGGLHVAASGAKPSKRQTLHLSRPPSSGAVAPSSRRPLAPVLPRPAAPGAEAVEETAEVAQSLLAAVHSAAAQLGDAEVDNGRTAQEVLTDPQALESASRWRAGTAPRQLTAALARLTTSLRAWVSAPTRTAATPSPSTLTPARPRPVQAHRGPQSAPQPIVIAWLRWLVSCRWKTGLAILFILMFPRLVALCLALLVKLFIRGTVALLTHVCRELVQQIMGAANEIEENLITWLSQQLGVRQQPAAPLYLTSHPAPPPPPELAPASTLPARPFDLLTVVLLVWNLRRGQPAGGVGREQ
ncbi:osm1 [Symbiodinium sp. CCMP2592]|nr:osm1 [Symbiodinium sp. CCMP2592]